MGKFKKVLCKCAVCNKPFSAYGPTDLCKQCAEKKKFSDLGVIIPKRAIRNGNDRVEAFMDHIRALDKMEG